MIFPETGLDGAQASLVKGVVRMPIKIPDGMPAKEILEQEQIFVMPEDRAFHQDIRPLKILILNLMPIKETTETQVLRLLGNTPLQVETIFLRMQSHRSKNTSQDHLEAFYKTFDAVRDRFFDGMIVTGAPLEHLDFEEVTYWSEFQTIMDWTLEHVTSTFYICWAAQAGLYHHFGIPKYLMAEKLFGVFAHHVVKSVNLVHGFDDEFFVPHSRYATTRAEDILRHPDLELIADSDEAGVYMVTSKDGRQVFVTGHSEYDRMTLLSEYTRDRTKGLNTSLPRHYFPDNDPAKTPIMRWRSHAHILFFNWLNYYVYQETPYDIEQGIRQSLNITKRV